MCTLTDEQISEIAECIDTDDICYLNADSGEKIFINSHTMSEYDSLWEEEEEEEGPDDSWPDWQKEEYADLKASWEKIDSWEHVLQIEKPEPHESFEFMERFVDEVIPGGKLKEDLWRALSRSHPFRNFKEIIHNGNYREEWFAFKQKALERYVRRRIEAYEMS